MRGILFGGEERKELFIVGIFKNSVRTKKKQTRSSPLITATD